MEKIIHDTARVSGVFKTFAERECKGISNLYFQLSQDISKEKDLLKLAMKCRERQPIPNLFYGSIHYLLLKYKDEELAEYYPSIYKNKNLKIPINLFKEFCKRREEEIIEILRNRIVQTNSINRAGYIMPIISSGFKEERPINIVDIGTSSGLTMNFDLYEYNYGSKQYGRSEVKIKNEIIGGKLPEFDKIAIVKRKIGIDQNPLNLRNEDNSRWLKSLIWPDMEERFKKMEAAIEIAIESNVELYQANELKEFKNIINQIPKEEDLMIYHTHVLYQFTKGERAEFREMLDEIGEKLQIFSSRSECCV